MLRRYPGDVPERRRPLAGPPGTYAARMPGATIVDFPCSICGAPVGYQELYPPGVPRAAGRGGEDPGRRLDRHWHYVSDGDRYGDSELTLAAFAEEYPEAVAILLYRGAERLRIGNVWCIPVEAFLRDLKPGRSLFAAPSEARRSRR